MRRACLFRLSCSQSLLPLFSLQIAILLITDYSTIVLTWTLVPCTISLSYLPGSNRYLLSPFSFPSLSFLSLLSTFINITTVDFFFFLHFFLIAFFFSLAATESRLVPFLSFLLLLHLHLHLSFSILPLPHPPPSLYPPRPASPWLRDGLLYVPLAFLPPPGPVASHLFTPTGGSTWRAR